MNVRDLIHILQNGSTSLHMSARNNHREVAGLLIRYGVDVNIKDKVSTPPIPISNISPSHYNNYYIICLIFHD